VFQLLFLVVDDDELSRELLTMLLEREGHEVEVAVSGEEGLARLSGEVSGARFEPDVILADMQMTGVSGSELASLLRAISRQNTRLFAMSGSQPAASELAGFDGFLLKPFTMEELSGALGPTLPDRMVDHDPISLAASAESTEASEEGLPAINETIYGQLAKSMTAVQLGQMYTLCLNDARIRIARMVASAQAGDDEGYRKEAHTVKGGCGMIGATELYRLAETAESKGLSTGGNAGSGNGTNSIKALLDRLSRACDRLERILREQT